MAIASSAIADTIQLAAQPVTSGTTKKIVKANRMFHDIIDAECIFIELGDEANEKIGDEDETDIANGSCPVFGYETAKVIDPRLKNYFNDQGACIPLGKKIKSVHYKPNKNALSIVGKPGSLNLLIFLANVIHLQLNSFQIV